MVGEFAQKIPAVSPRLYLQEASTTAPGLPGDQTQGLFSQHLQTFAKRAFSAQFLRLSSLNINLVAPKDGTGRGLFFWGRAKITDFEGLTHRQKALGEKLPDPTFNSRN